MLTFFFLELLLVGIWVFLLIWENKEYYKKLRKQEERRKRVEASKKKRVRELKWPEGVPHPENKE